ncbi:MAG: endonuclease MutS2 [Nitrospirae bacterium]|nr:MAG: endonuclease MutS2 [Nitrospirota bacterium]
MRLIGPLHPATDERGSDLGKDLPDLCRRQGHGVGVYYASFGNEAFVKNRDALLAKARQVLEWNAVLEALAGRAVSALGAERCRSLPLAETLEEASTSLRETAEMVALEASGEGLPLTSFPDLRLVVERAAKGALLLAVDCRDLAIVLGLVSDILRYLQRRRDEAPTLSAVAADLDDLPDLKRAIDRCVDHEGNIRESATPELRDLLHHANALKQKIRAKLETMLGSPRFADLLQEQYFAQRENRYVLPIKVERKSEVPGIVHDMSASGATVFIEPRELVDLNNQIKEADLAVDREVHRILQDLSQQVAAHADALRIGLDVLGRLDCLRAKASLARLLKASDPLVNAEGRIRLKEARHPLLVLSRLQGQEPVVPNDLDLCDPVRVLIISGPNTGGKTVTLKIVGLFALMVRAGLQLPCAPGSDMAFFSEVYADIGDAQDLTKDLSSFSAHMTDMIALLREAGPAALVLLDEPVTSTDPAEGAALAHALLVHLAERGFTVVATTHYNALKALAQSHPGFANASVEFNIATLAPTYRLILGMPGGSSAIDIAGRLGMDEAILDESVRLVDARERALERLMEELQETRRKLDEDARRTAELLAEAETAARLQKELAARLAATEQESRKTVRKKVTDEILKARAEVQSVIEEIKTDKRLVKAREAKERLGTRGVLLENPSGKKRVRIRMGEAEVSVAVSDLAGLAEVAGEAASQEIRGKKTVGAQHAAPLQMQESSTVLDVRGQTAEEAQEAVVACLDRAALAGAQTVRIIHGHGTGRLKQALRDYLKTSPYVASFRPGERAEGGDGVTVVNVK